MADPLSALHGGIGDRTLLRVLNPGMCYQSVHTHGNHMEWITDNGQIRDDIWSKDCIYLEGNMGKFDAIYPYDAPPDHGNQLQQVYTPCICIPRCHKPQAVACTCLAHLLTFISNKENYYGKKTIKQHRHNNN